jgi:hypothetical protein
LKRIGEKAKLEEEIIIKCTTDGELKEISFKKYE